MTRTQIKALIGLGLFALAWLIHDIALTPFSHSLSRQLGMRQPVPGELLLPNYALTCGLRVLFWSALIFLLLRILRTPLLALRIDRRRALINFCSGFAVAAGLLLGVALIFLVTGAGSFAVRASDPLQGLGQALAWLGGDLILAVAEELAFRGIVMGLLLLLVGDRWAILLSAIAFSAAHYRVGGGQAVFFAYVIVQGLILGLATLRTRELGWAIGYHASWNWMTGIVLGMSVGGYAATNTVLGFKPDGPAWLTGGAVGPEASVVTLSMLGIVTAVLCWRNQIFRTEPAENEEWRSKPSRPDRRAL